MIVNVERVWCAVAARHHTFVAGKIQKMIKFLQACKGPVLIQHKLVGYLQTHRDALCRCDPLPLPGVVAAFALAFPHARDVAYVNGLFEKYLCYDSFILKEKLVLLKKWDAYALLAATDTMVCPYCHIVPIDTYVSEDGSESYRPNIDHYFPKAEFPFLALSIGNFIPCCEKCNGSQMKGTKRFDLIPHLHPLVDPENITFRLTPKTLDMDPKVLALQAGNAFYKIELVASNGACSKVDNSLATFKLIARYQVCLPDALSVAKLSRRIARDKMLSKELCDLPFADDQPLGFDQTDDSYKNVLMGKLKLDIARQYGVI